MTKCKARPRISDRMQIARADETEGHFLHHSILTLTGSDSHWVYLSSYLQQTPLLSHHQMLNPSQDRYLSHLIRSLCGLHDTRLSAVCLLRTPSNAHQLQHLAPETNRRIKKGGFISVYRGTFPYQIGLRGLDELGAVDDLPEGEGGEGWRIC